MCFVVIFSAFSLGFPGRVCSVVGASVFAATIYRCGARHSHRCNLPDHIPSSLRSSCSFLCFILDDPLSASHSRRPSLCITTFSPHRRGESEWITRSRSPKHRRGENEWISLRRGFAYVFINFAFNMLWWSTRFYQCASRPATSTQMLRSRPGEIQETHAAGPRIRRGFPCSHSAHDTPGLHTFPAM